MNMILHGDDIADIRQGVEIRNKKYIDLKLIWVNSCLIGEV